MGEGSHASLESLPVELLSHICGLVSHSPAAPTSDLAQLRLTAKWLHQIATPLYWHTIDMFAGDGGEVGAQDTLLARLLRMKGEGGARKPRKLVRELMLWVSAVVARWHVLPAHLTPTAGPQWLLGIVGPISWAACVAPGER